MKQSGREECLAEILGMVGEGLSVRRVHQGLVAEGDWEVVGRESRALSKSLTNPILGLPA